MTAPGAVASTWRESCLSRSFSGSSGASMRASVSGAPVTHSDPTTGGNTPATPAPVAWWQLWQLLL